MIVGWICCGSDSGLCCGSCCFLVVLGRFWIGWCGVGGSWCCVGLLVCCGRDGRMFWEWWWRLFFSRVVWIVNWLGCFWCSVLCNWVFLGVCGLFIWCYRVCLGMLGIGLGGWFLELLFVFVVVGWVCFVGVVVIGLGFGVWCCFLVYSWFFVLMYGFWWSVCCVLGCELFVGVCWGGWIGDRVVGLGWNFVVFCSVGWIGIVVWFVVFLVRDWCRVCLVGWWVVFLVVCWGWSVVGSWIGGDRCWCWCVGESCGNWWKIWCFCNDRYLGW